MLRSGGLDELTPEAFDFVTCVNYVGYFNCVRTVSQIMQAQYVADGSRFYDIVQINSKSGLEGTTLAGRTLNNPDQSEIAYMAVHSVMPHKTDFIQAVFAPLREKRNVRNRAMIANINACTALLGVIIDFEQDVLPRSQYRNGGSVTERHLLWALSGKMLQVLGVSGLSEALERLEITPSALQKSKLTADHPNLQYDLLGLFKAHLVTRFYIPATEECMHLRDLVRVSEEAGTILCYPYLGDVGVSVTGDKKQEPFEDGFLDELFAVLYDEAIRGITYMPSRNTAAQIARLRMLCTRYGMIEISGEDINTPGQSFICEKLTDPDFAYLVEATRMLIAREKGER